VADQFEIERKTHVETIYGKDAQGNKIDDVWVDIESIDSIITEEGGGLTFQRRKWVFKKDAEARKKRKLTLKNPNDESQTIEIEITDEMTLETGGGLSYQRVTWKFNNTDANKERKFRVDQVYHAEPKDGGGKDVDRDQKIEVEVIEKFTVETGGGPSYQREFIVMSLNKILPKQDESLQPGWYYRGKDRERYPSERETIKGAKP
jgi:hypothetical protein